MSTSTPQDGSGDEAFAYFVTTAVPKVIGLLITAQRIAQERGLTAIGKSAADISLGMLKDINAAAVESAGDADGTIIRLIFETRHSNRPITGDIATHIHSLPGPLGSVQVALLKELDKIINPVGDYGSFWQAQEYGTGSKGFYGDVPSQVGRVLRGTFQDSGTPPNPDMRGLGAGRDIAFVPGGIDAGWGTISVDLPGRHFLRDGAAEAGARYIRRMNAIQTKWISRIRELQDELKTQLGRGGGTVSGILEA